METKNAETKKPFYKRGWFIIIAIILVVVVISGIGKDDEANRRDDWLEIGEGESKQLDWSEIELNEFIPEPENKYGEITTNRSNLAKAPEEIEDTNVSTEIETTTSTEEKNTENKETNKNNSSNSNELGKDFKEAMDSYEEFMDEYVDFMKKYANSDGTDMSLIYDYTNYLSKYAEVCEDFAKWDDEEMNMAETAYYIEVQTRVNKKLLEVAQ